MPRARIDRRAASEQLMQRTQESANKVSDSGRFMSYINQDIPLSQFKVHTGDNFLDIIPFIVGNNYPTRTYSNLKPGDITYLLDIFVHFGVGVNDDAYVCPNRNYGQRCPMCEHAEEISSQIPEEVWDLQNPETDPDYGHLVKLYNKLKAKRRCVYNVLDWTNENDPAALREGVQYWESSHYLFEKQLVAVAKKPRGGGYVNFSDLDTGQTIFFQKTGQGRSLKYEGIRFEPRPEPISEEHELQAVSLDEYITVPSYDELYEAHYGEPAPAAGGKTVQQQAAAEAPATATRGRSKGAVQQQETPPSRGRRGSTTANVEDVSDRDVDVGDAIDEGEKLLKQAANPPAATRGRARTAPATTNTEGDQCPAGHVFGKDVDKFENDCNDCEKWDDCARTASELEAEASRKAATEQPARATRTARQQPAQQPAAAPATTSRRPRRG